MDHNFMITSLIAGGSHIFAQLHWKVAFVQAAESSRCVQRVPVDRVLLIDIMCVAACRARSPQQHVERRREPLAVVLARTLMCLS